MLICYIALLTLLIGNTFYARNIIASVLVMVWAARLAGKGLLPLIFGYSIIPIDS